MGHVDLKILRNIYRCSHRLNRTSKEKRGHGKQDRLLKDSRSKILCFVVIEV